MATMAVHAVFVAPLFPETTRRFIAVAVSLRGLASLVRVKRS